MARAVKSSLVGLASPQQKCTKVFVSSDIRIDVLCPRVIKYGTHHRLTAIGIADRLSYRLIKRIAIGTADKFLITHVTFQETNIYGFHS
jgi:hypothetical protein